MLVDTIQIAGVLVLSVSSIGGWIYTLRQNGKSEGRHQEQVTALKKAVDNLPCVADRSYLEGIGRLNAQAESLTAGMNRVEAEQHATNSRIDNLMASLKRPG